MNLQRFLSSILLVCLFAVNAHSSEQSDKVDAIVAQLKAVQVQLDTMVDVGGEYAYKQLTMKNKFSPFAVGVNQDDQIIVLEIPKTETKASFTDKIIKLRQMLKLSATKNKITAGALFVQAEVPHQGTLMAGVAIEMEHEEGLSILRFSPYDIDLKTQKLKFRKPVDKVKPVVFFKGPGK